MIKVTINNYTATKDQIYQLFRNLSNAGFNTTRSIAVSDPIANRTDYIITAKWEAIHDILRITSDVFPDLEVGAQNENAEFTFGIDYVLLATD